MSFVYPYVSFFFVFLHELHVMDETLRILFFKFQCLLRAAENASTAIINALI